MYRYRHSRVSCGAQISSSMAPPAASSSLKRKLDLSSPPHGDSPESHPIPKHPRIEIPHPDPHPAPSHHDDSFDEDDPKRVRVLPLSVSTIDAGEQDLDAMHRWNILTKGFFYSKGSDLRAGYWVYHRNHMVAKALIWNDEFDEIRYDHQGYSPCMRGLNKANVSPVSIGLMAILDAIAWARNFVSFAHWYIYSDNLDALKLVDMYQRNMQFMKFHHERPLLDYILDAAHTGNIHLHRR